MTTFNQQPYFDDFSKEKGFHRILFIPKKAVQVRELNQIQSIFHNQIKQFGDNIFANGSMVIPGNVTVDTEFPFVKVNVNNYEVVKDQLKNQNVYIVGATTKIKANLIMVYPAEGSDPTTLYVQYMDGGTAGTSTELMTGEEFTLYDVNKTPITTGSVIAAGLGSRVGVNAGVYYINGNFVYTDSQSIVISKYTRTPTTKVGFRVVESIITADDDESLYDNAQGTPNFKAPGAHRYAIDLALTAYADGQQIPVDFIQIMSIRNGEIEKIVRGSDYNLIEDTLAKRTYDESGDYTVEPFTIKIREHLDTGSNDGVYPAPEGDESKFVVGVEKGRAYVRGYEVENNVTLNLDVNKARATNVINNSSVSTPIGFYVETSWAVPLMPLVASMQKIAFYSGTVSAVNGNPEGSVIGYGHVRYIRKISATKYRLYMFNLTDVNGVPSTAFIKTAKAVKSFEGTGWSTNILNSLYSTTDSKMVFPLATTNVKSLVQDSGSDTSFTTVKQYQMTADSNGSVTLTAGSNETFVAQDPQYGFAIFSDYTVADLDGNYVLGGTPVGKIMTINFGAGQAAKNVTINAQVVKETTVAKSKTLAAGVITGALVSNKMYLGKCDAISLTSVKLTDGTDVTKAFKLSPNRLETFYDVSFITKTDSSVQVTGNVTVEFTYFEHGVGDYFSVDSYAGIPYQDIPVDTINNKDYQLSDVIDFRPRINSDRTSFVGGVTGALPVPYGVVRMDLEHYLARIDKVYVDSRGNFGVLQGEPSLNPVMPSDVDNAMTLYTLEIPAYTASVTDIKAKQVSTKRFTMKDIDRLETRIKSLEYYVSLNALEASTATMQITDPTTGLNRFKNGFVVDSFVDHSVGDYTWDGYQCSINPDDGELRPQFSMNGVGLEINSAGSSNYVVKDDMIMLPYSEVSYLSQSMASSTMNVNPYAVYRWGGTLKLSPAFDSWIDTIYTDPDVTYSEYNNGKLTQTWKAWAVYWSGSDKPTTTVTITAANRVRTTTTSTTSTSVKEVNDKIVDTSVIPYMRNVKVNITGKGFRPGAVLYPFFDGQRVSQWVRPVGGSYNAPIKPDANGVVNCEFNIPAGKFRTGSKLFNLVDNSSNDREHSYSYGDATFTASGVVQKRQKQFVATRSSTVIVKRRGYDPLAQSFLVETDGGVFITSIDVYLAEKDPSVPLTIGIYTMDNGYPTTAMLPGSTKTLNPDEITVSANASAATRFTFDHPIYLEDGNEYCFILMSNSNLYEAWVARMGENEVSSAVGIAKQPYIGVLFKSQNASTWTADQTADLKFKINRAKFTSASGTVVLNNKSIETRVLNANPIITNSGSPELTITMSQHNMVPGAKIEIKNALGSGAITSELLNAQHTVTSVVDFNKFKITVGANASASGFIGGDQIEITQSYLASHVVPHFSELSLGNTTTAYSLSGMRGMTMHGAETPYQDTPNVVITNDAVNLLNEPLLIGSGLDESVNHAGKKSMAVTVNMSTERDNISPMIDLQNSNLVYVYNEVDSTGTVLANGSTTWAKYRTNIVGLANTANSLRTFMDIMKPQEASVAVSYRIGNSEAEVELATWVLMGSLTNNTSNDIDTYLEHEFSADAVGDFTFFQIMIQMRSTSCVKAPVIKRFRTLALGT